MKIPSYHYNKYKKKYVLDESFSYKSRYGLYVYIPKAYESDGATGAIDITTASFWVHDYLCDYGKFSNGAKCSNWQASTILYDILKSEGRWFRARTWWVATFLFGGGEARKNGMW